MEELAKSPQLGSPVSDSSSFMETGQFSGLAGSAGSRARAMLAAIVKDKKVAHGQNIYSYSQSLMPRRLECPCPSGMEPTGKDVPA